MTKFGAFALGVGAWTALTALGSACTIDVQEEHPAAEEAVGIVEQAAIGSSCNDDTA